jgi:hypothetical protein
MKTAIKFVGSDTLITPDWLRSHSACSDGYEWACGVIGEGMALEKFLPKFQRADWMLWTLKRAATIDKITYVRIAIKCAESVIGIYEKKYKKDDRPRKAIEAAIACVKDPSEENRIAAKAASAAAYAARADAAYLGLAEAANSAANVAAYAARAAAYAARAAAAYLGLAEAANVAADAADAADSAVDAAAATSSAASSAAYAAKKTMHKKLCAMILREIAPQTEKVDTKTI